MLNTVTEPEHDVGPPIALGVLKGDQEAAGGWLVIPVVLAAPGIDINDPVRRDHDVPRVADIVREHGGAKSGGQRDSTIVLGAGRRARRAGVARLLRERWRSDREQQADGEGSSPAGVGSTGSQSHDGFLIDA